MAELPEEKSSGNPVFIFVAGERGADWPEKEVMVMKVRQIMHKELVTILPEATIHDAALRMKKENIGSILIVEKNNVLKGIVTDRDLSLAVAADFKDPKTTRASDIMAKYPVTIDADADVDFAIKIMNEKKVHRLPVCENEKVVGLLSTADLAVELKEEIDNFFGLEKALAKTH